VDSRARGLQGLRQRRAHSARRSYAARHVQAMLVPDTWHAFLHDRTTRVFCNLWITRRVRLTLPLTFRTGLPGTRHHQYRCSSQPLQICSSAGQTSPGSEDLFLQASLVATACCRHGQRASHVMGNVLHTSWQRASYVMGNLLHSECRLTFVPGYDDESVGDARCVTIRTCCCSSNG
jgi:hypothetical protein